MACGEDLPQDLPQAPAHKAADYHEMCENEYGDERLDVLWHLEG